MDELEIIFKLTKVAKTTGGDRYEADFPGQPKPMAIYFPQSFSRVNGRPVPAIGCKFWVPTE